MQLSKAQPQPILAIQPNIRFIFCQLQLRWKHSVIRLNTKTSSCCMENERHSWDTVEFHWLLILHNIYKIKITDFLSPISNIAIFLWSLITNLGIHYWGKSSVYRTTSSFKLNWNTSWRPWPQVHSFISTQFTFIFLWMLTLQISSCEKQLLHCQN